ncbi:hypothetical protein PC123_g11716 [Phytophthora cactorum]|nr:hypothetical protein PC123_g11716 [Phytophthora cactorum]
MGATTVQKDIGYPDNEAQFLELTLVKIYNTLVVIHAMILTPGRLFTFQNGQCSRHFQESYKANIGLVY